MKNKSPDLKFRYAQGLGDIIACFLHSKPVSWLTVLITGKKEPCKQCSIRRNALNTLLPIKFWKLFFENEKELVLNLSEDYKKNGYNVNLDLEKLTVSTSKADSGNLIEPINAVEPIQETPRVLNTDDLSKYTLVTSDTNRCDNFLIKLEIYKKKN
jgi:hypothetical protein